MFNLKSKTRHEKIMALIICQVEKLLNEMQNDGKDLSNIKLKKFQKTHHINCKCELCTFANTKNDPSLRGLTEDGFKVFIDSNKKNHI